MSELTKVCNKCSETKPLSSFRPNAKCKLGVVGTCRECAYEHQRQYRLKNIEAISAKNAVWRAENQDKIREYGRRARTDDPEGHRARKMAWRHANPEQVLESGRQYRRSDPDAARERVRSFRRRNPERVKAWALASYYRRRDDPQFRLECAIRVGVLRGIAREGKCGTKTFVALGYTPEQLMRHLEALFLPGMSWETHGVHGWHIDHVRPLDSFRYTSVRDEEFAQAWALSNLQPLWAADNIRKHAKWNPAVG